MSILYVSYKIFWLVCEQNDNVERPANHMLQLGGGGGLGVSVGPIQYPRRGGGIVTV